MVTRKVKRIKVSQLNSNRKKFKRLKKKLKVEGDVYSGLKLGGFKW